MLHCQAGSLEPQFFRVFTVALGQMVAEREYCGPVYAIFRGGSKSGFRYPLAICGSSGRRNRSRAF